MRQDHVPGGERAARNDRSFETDMKEVVMTRSEGRGVGPVGRRNESRRASATTVRVLMTAIALGAAAGAWAQAGVDARLGVAIDALRPGAFAGETRGTFDGTLAPELRFSAERGRLYYSLDGGSYNTPGDWSFLAHALGASYRLDLAGKDKARLHLGGSGTLRRNGEAWSYADYDARSAFANLELRPQEGTTVRTGYRLADRTFDELTDLNQFEQDAFASVNINLQSRTTLIAEAHFGWKSYEGETMYAAVPQPAAPGSVSPGSGQESSGGQGQGSGGQGTHGSGTLTGPRETTSLLVPAGTSAEHARQWNLLLRVAQGLGDRTGLHAQGFLRRTGGRVPPALVTTPAGFFDDGVYDDPFASDLGAVSTGIRHAFAGGADVHAFASWQAKDYTSTVALDATGQPLPGDPLRNDRITRGGAGLSLPLLTQKTGAFSLAVALDYAFTQSRSNDAFYDYEDHAVGVTLTLGR
jgi:hypothetical protein